MVNIPALITKEVEVLGLKKVLLLLVIFASLMLALTMTVYMHETLHLAVLPMTGINMAHFWMYFILLGVSMVLGLIAIYGKKVPSLIMRRGSMSPAFMVMLLGFLVSVSLIGVNTVMETWYTLEILPALNFFYFTAGLVPTMVGTLAYILRVYTRLVELGTETPPKKPYVAELYMRELKR